MSERNLHQTLAGCSENEKGGTNDVSTRPSFSTHLRGEKLVFNETQFWVKKQNHRQYITFGHACIPNAVPASVSEKHKNKTRRQYITFAHPRSYFTVPASVSEKRKNETRRQYITLAHTRSPFTVPANVSKTPQKQRTT